MLLISVLEVVGNIVGRLDEGLHGGLIGEVAVELCLGLGEGIKLLNGKVVVSNLREGE